jgi:hypothetical protein
MQHTKAEKLLIELGDIFRNTVVSETEPLFSKAEIENPWFTLQNQQKAIQGWAESLRADKVDKWLSGYQFRETNAKPLKVGIIAAGNIPLVGLHDLLCVLISGHQACIKLSSQDTVLMKWVVDLILNISPELADKIEIKENLVKDADAFIGTGSNNTARYFEYYFRNKPHIIRKNRNSVAVVSATASKEDMTKLSDDMFSFFGMGCRNVTKIYLNRNKTIVELLDCLNDYADMINHHKYANNYHYHKAILLMNLDKHLDNGFAVWQEKENIHAPLGTINYQYYDDIDSLTTTLLSQSDQIQCIVSDKEIKNLKTVKPGQAQSPELWDYADGIDTLEFLLKL